MNKGNQPYTFPGQIPDARRGWDDPDEPERARQKRAAVWALISDGQWHDRDKEMRPVGGSESTKRFREWRKEFEDDPRYVFEIKKFPRGRREYRMTYTGTSLPNQPPPITKKPTTPTKSVVVEYEDPYMVPISVKP